MKVKRPKEGEKLMGKIKSLSKRLVLMQGDL